jgi:Hg(II)-responsive transcriptional regulator
MLTSGQLAKRAGVGVETLRFYEREKLLPEPARTTAGYRQYPDAAVERVRFIRRAQLLGFQLRDIKELLALREAAGDDCRDVRAKAVAKLADIDAKIRDLGAMRAELTRLVAACDGTLPAAECPILTAIRDHARPSWRVRREVRTLQRRPARRGP